MRVLRRIGAGVLTMLSAAGTVILFLIVLLLLPLSVAGMVVDYILFRPSRELLAVLRRIESRLS
jgi:hypothetical protein